MPTQAPEFHKGARVRITRYGGVGEAGEYIPSSLDGLLGNVTAIYGGKFYRVELDDDPDADLLPSPLVYAHEMELVNE